MGMRDSGWIILFSENGQEAYDNLLQALRIAEHPDVLLPVVVCQDGFITSHGTERVEIYDDAEVKTFVGDYDPQWPLLDLEKPKTYGAAGFSDCYYEFKRQQMEAMDNALGVIQDIAEAFNRQFDRDYGLFEAYRLEDAEVAVVVTSSTAGTTKVVVDQLREDGIKAGLLKPRVFRPFPAREMARAVRHLRAVGVLDRSVSFGAMANAGPWYLELMAALAYHGVDVPVAGCVYGIGGRDLTPGEIEEVYRGLLEAAETGQVVHRVQHLGVRE
jgi:pyruvate ferredoxin oxidoreductase alpha subunit